jgi:hypothetical protein
MSRNLTLCTGNIFGTQLRFGQIISYCGLPTPEFYTAEMGYRNLRVGMEGHRTDGQRKFKPWQWDQVRPIADAIKEMFLPLTFRDFAQQVFALRSEENPIVSFGETGECCDQKAGYILVRDIPTTLCPVSCLSQAIPIVRTLVSTGTMNERAAVGLLKRMISAGLTEEITDAFFQAVREDEIISRFEWETYSTRLSIFLASASVA